MGENTNIEWTHHTFNPWIGCQKVGPGCDHCYAETWDARGLQQRESRWGAHAARTRTSPANWRKPLAWNKAAKEAGKRARVFCASLADVFDNHASILPEWRADLWALIRATPNLDWMLLTKRPGNIGNMLPVPFDFEKQYPNVWLGCTVVNQEEADRDVPKLLAVPAAVRFLSMEPLLGAVDIVPYIGGRSYLCDCGWQRTERNVMFLGKRTTCLECGKDHKIFPTANLVIVGGESGPGARPMHPDWARSLRDQCQAAGVAFHFKQWGEWKPTPSDLGDWPTHEPGFLRLNAEGRSSCDGWPMQRVGKKFAGRLLDGRAWDEMPEVRHV